MKFQNIQAIIEILTEATVRHPGLQVDVGGCDNTCFGSQDSVATHPEELLVLENGQQLGLEFSGKVADFIEKYRAFTRLFKASRPRSRRSRKGSLFVAKKLGL